MQKKIGNSSAKKNECDIDYVVIVKNIWYYDVAMLINGAFNVRAMIVIKQSEFRGIDVIRSIYTPKRGAHTWKWCQHVDGFSFRFFFRR